MFRERLGTQSLAGHFGDMKVWSHSLHYLYEGSFNGLHMSSFADLETVSCDLQHISLGLISPIRFSFRYWSVRPQWWHVGRTKPTWWSRLRAPVFSSGAHPLRLSCRGRW